MDYITTLSLFYRARYPQEIIFVGPLQLPIYIDRSIQTNVALKLFKGDQTVWAQCNKTCYVYNLRTFVISWSVCPCEAFSVQSNVCTRPEPIRVKQGRLLALPTNNRLGCKGLTGTNSLLRTFVHYGRNFFITFAHNVAF